MTVEELEGKIASLECEVINERELTTYWKGKFDQLYREMNDNPTSDENIRQRLYWYQKRYSPLLKRMREAERLQGLPLREVAKIAIQRGRTINRLERKLGKRNRLSAKQHRYLKSKNREIQSLLAESVPPVY